MKASTLTLAFAALAAAVPSTHVFIEVDEVPLKVDNEITPTRHQTPAAQRKNPKFDDSLIADHPDKKLLANINAYFKTFVDPSPEDMRSFQTDDYTMTDIPLCIVNVDRDYWYAGNKAFVAMTTDTNVTAITLDGSSEPGKFSILENLVEFRLTMDPPEGPAKNLPPGAKKGDYVAMIMLSTIWWNEDGKVTRELEYGRLIWDDFALEPFLKGKKAESVKNLYLNSVKSGL